MVAYALAAVAAMARRGDIAPESGAISHARVPLLGKRSGSSLGSLVRPALTTRLADWLLWSGSLLGAGAWTLRSVSSGHVALAGLYDVLLGLAVLMAPLAWVARRLAGRTPAWFDPLAGAVLLVPVGFVMDPVSQPMPAVLDSPLFIPHVGAYLLGYVLLLKAAAVGATAVAMPANRADLAERVAYRLSGLAIGLLTADLVLGAAWGQRAWGDWWNWDPKELWSLATWLMVAMYLHVRSLGPGIRRRVAPAVLAGSAVLAVVTLVWVNLSPRFAGLHSYAAN